jgi:uncharacterized damage-inducible protein DinB
MIMPSRALTELLRGKGAHADPIACIEDLPVELAARQVAGFPHSISQLVFHMNYWMNYDLKRAGGHKLPYPEHNSESFPASPVVDAEQWDHFKSQFAVLLENAAALANATRQDLDRQVEPAHAGHNKIAGTLEAILWQLVAHNSYHIGQIAAIRRALGAWPPRHGGDTW